MGKDIGFHIVSRKSGGDSKSENLVSCLAKYRSRWMSRPQNWSKMMQNMVFTAHEGIVIPSTKNSISQTVFQSVTHAPDTAWGSPWSGFDGFYDEPLATTGFTESYAPSLLLADFKV